MRLDKRFRVVSDNCGSLDLVHHLILVVDLNVTVYICGAQENRRKWRAGDIAMSVDWVQDI